MIAIILVRIVTIGLGPKQWRKKMKKKEKIKTAYDMTDEEVAASVDLNGTDFDESGDMAEELQDIMEGNS